MKIKGGSCSPDLCATEGRRRVTVGQCLHFSGLYDAEQDADRGSYHLLRGALLRRHQPTGQEVLLPVQLLLQGRDRRAQAAQSRPLAARQARWGHTALPLLHRIRVAHPHGACRDGSKLGWADGGPESGHALQLASALWERPDGLRQGTPACSKAAAPILCGQPLHKDTQSHPCCPEATTVELEGLRARYGAMVSSYHNDRQFRSQAAMLIPVHLCPARGPVGWEDALARLTVHMQL